MSRTGAAVLRWMQNVPHVHLNDDHARMVIFQEMLCIVKVPVVL